MIVNRLKIHDSEFEDVLNTYHLKSIEIEELMAQYFSILESIVDEKILEGETACALQNFTALTKLALKAEIGNIMSEHNEKVKHFIDEVTQQDDTELES